MTVRDEVCGMTITEDQIATTFAFQGRLYHFCSDRCRRHFEEHPGWYVPVKPDEDRADGWGENGGE